MSDKRIERWHTADADNVHRAVNATVDHIRSLQRSRLERDRLHLRLYCPDVSGNGEDALSVLKRDRPQFNLIKQGVDTMASQVATQKYLPQYVITEGEFTFQRTARLRTRVLEGQAYDMGLHEMMAAAFLGAGITGTDHLVGFLDEKNEPAVEKALPGEILVDPRAAITGDVVEIFRDRGVSRDAIAALYPDASEAQIGSAAPPHDNGRNLLFMPRDRLLDEVQVREAWYWGPGKGRHVIALSTCVLVDEEWEWGNPTVPVRYQRRPVGYWGLGLAEIGRDSQARMDELLTRITDCQRIGSTAWMVIDRNAKIRVETLSNQPLSMIQGDFRAGNYPRVEVFNATPPELFAEVDRIRERFLSETGISAMAAESKKPAGLDSGRAQLVFEDLTSKRHQPIADGYKAAWHKLFELLERLNARAQEANGDYSVVARTQRGLVPLTKMVKWSDVGMPEESYRLTMLLSSDLPYQLAGRMQAVSEYLSSNMLQRPNAQRAVMDGPDASLQRLELADTDAVMHDAEEILDGRDAQPDPYQNLQIAADVMRRVYLQTKTQGAPEDTLAKLRRYVDIALAESRVAANPSLASEQQMAATVAAQAAQAKPTIGGMTAASGGELAPMEQTPPSAG
jgi:hypothetical protein